MIFIVFWVSVVLTGFGGGSFLTGDGGGGWVVMVGWCWVDGGICVLVVVVLFCESVRDGGFCVLF